MRFETSGKESVKLEDVDDIISNSDDKSTRARQVKTNASQHAEKTTVEVQIPAFCLAEGTTGHRNSSDKQPSWPKNDMQANGGYQFVATPSFSKDFPNTPNGAETNNANGSLSAEPMRRTDQKSAKIKVSTEIRSSPTPSSTIEAGDEDSAEEEIVTAGARATLNNSKSARTAPRLKPNVIYEGHREPGASSSDEESDESEEHSVEPEDTKPRRVGFPPVEELPAWFPENIKHMYRVDRHGGSLSYKASSSALSEITSNKRQELNEITRYRSALEIIYRRKWRKYIKAGRARWQLQQALHHLKCRPLTKAFYKYRKEQFRTWKAKGLKLWKRLEKTHRGILILEETININFRQERIIHEKHLGRGRT